MKKNKLKMGIFGVILLAAVTVFAANNYHLDIANMVETLSDSVITIGVEHGFAHAGKAFYCDTADITMADTETLILAFKTPNTDKLVHLVVDFASKAGGHLDIIEGPGWTTQTGSQVSIFNRKRSSTNASVLLEDSQAGGFAANGKMVLNPSSFTGGSSIRNLYVFTATGGRGRGSTRASGEIILKPNTTYGVKYTADGSTNAGALDLVWYEHLSLGNTYYAIGDNL